MYKPLTIEQKKIIWEALNNAGFPDVVDLLEFYASVMADKMGLDTNIAGAKQFISISEALKDAGKKIKTALNPNNKRRRKGKR
jgi:hypothetical protein